MPKTLSCPRCQFTRSWFVRRSYRKCKRCRSEWSLRTLYPVAGFRLSRKEWLQVTETSLRDETIQSVARECRLSFVTAQRAVAVLRSVMSRDVPERLSGVCEADETYVGGSFKNKAIHIRRRGSIGGRGTSKQGIFGIVQRHPAQVRTWFIADATGPTIRALVCRFVAKGSSVYTDGHRGYRRLIRQGYRHDWVDHQAGEYARGEVHTQTIDGFWGLLKTHLDSIGGIRKRYLHLFIGEYQWRYNFRHLTREEQSQKLFELLKRFGGRFYIFPTTDLRIMYGATDANCQSVSPCKSVDPLNTKTCSNLTIV